MLLVLCLSMWVLTDNLIKPAAENNTNNVLIEQNILQEEISDTEQILSIANDLFQGFQGGFQSNQGQFEKSVSYFVANSQMQIQFQSSQLQLTILTLPAGKAGGERR